MSGVNVTDPRINGNGNGAHLNGVVRKRPVKPAAPKAAPELSGFATVAAQPIDAQMWPVHAVLWLQPVLMVVAPRSSGIEIERRHRVPVPDFLHTRMVPAACSHRSEHRCEPLTPDLGHGIPISDLSPLGWEPRAVRTERSQELK